MLRLSINGVEDLRVETENVEPTFMVAGDGGMRVVDRIDFVRVFNGFYELCHNHWDSKLAEEYERIGQFLRVKRLTIEQWIDIFSNLGDDEEVEIVWLDSTNEWVLCFETELFEDGFKTEREAMDRIEMIEELI